MSSRVDYFFRQKVTEAELDLAFELLEQADRNLAADVGIYGIIAGAVPAPHSPVPSLTLDLTAPARAYDRLGQRIFFGTGQTVDCGVDLVGIPTDVTTADNERWLGIFLRFKRHLSDPRTDGNSQQVFFRRDESFEVVVRQAPEAAAGAAPKVVLQPEELLLCDVRRHRGQTQILLADIDTSRRQAFVFAHSTSVAVTTGAWGILSPLGETVQAALDEVDAELGEHFTSAGRRHAATAIDYAAHGFVGAGNVQAALDEVVDDLTSAAAGTSGATRVGVDASAGTPNTLFAGTVKTQLNTLLGLLNSHVGAAGAHAASAIAATAHNNIATTNVQAQLQEVVTDLLATSAAAPGAGLVGVDAIAGTPTAIAAGTLRSALTTLLSGLNGHASQANGAHAASAISVADVSNNLNAANVESALNEVLESLKGDHFRSNEANTGQHRAIRQPNLGGTKALLWDSVGNGGAAAHFRVYADSDSIWFTVNASWSGVAWVRDNTGYTSGGFRFSRSDFEILQDATYTATFARWSRSAKLTMGTTSFEMSGAAQEEGRCGLKLHNPLSTAAYTIAGSTVMFRSRLQGGPSSITLTALSGTFMGAVASVDTLTRDGFALSVYVNPLDANTTAAWWGNYSAIG